MTQMHNIAGQDGSVMVPVLAENGSLMAYLVYPNPQGVLQEYYPSQTTLRPLRDHSQTTLWQLSPVEDAGMPPTGRYDGSFLFNQHKESLSWAGQLFIQSQKRKKMPTDERKLVSADRVKNDPVFERTRENMAEFTRAGKAAKLMRTIFREVMVNAKDRITQARLVKVFSRIITTDPLNARGERTVNKGDLRQLQGFNFNGRAGIKDSFFVRCPVSLNRAVGQVGINIPAFVPRNMVEGIGGTTHFRIVAAAATINFDTEAYEFSMQSTPDLPWDHDLTDPATLTMALPGNSPDVIVTALGIEYYQRVNSRSYALKTGELNATTVVLVDVPV